MQKYYSTLSSPAHPKDAQHVPSGTDAVPSVVTPAALPCPRCGVIDTPAIGLGNGSLSFTEEVVQ